MKRQILTLGFAIIMTAAMLTGCGEKDNNPTTTPEATPTKAAANKTPTTAPTKVPTETPTEAPTTTPEPVVKTDFDECYEIAVAFGEAVASGKFKTLEEINAHLKKTYNVEAFNTEFGYDNAGNVIFFFDRNLKSWSSLGHSETKVKMCDRLEYLDDSWYSDEKQVFYKERCERLMKHLNVSTLTREKAVGCKDNNKISFDGTYVTLDINFLKVREFDGWILLVGIGGW